MDSFFSEITGMTGGAVQAVSFEETNKMEELNTDDDDMDSEGDSSDMHQEITVEAKRTKRHAKLMESIASLDTNKRQKVSQRSEAGGEVSEFNLNDQDGSNSAVKMHELMSSLAHTPSHSELKKQLSNVQRNQKVLDAPLHKHQAEKIRRSGAYEAASKEVSRWDQVVQNNRKAEHLSFPLNQPVIGLQTTDQFVKKFKPSTPLEQEVYKILHGSKHHERPNKELTLAEEEAVACMNLEEAQERRAELQKTRALLSYYEAKCHRKKKIKSKMYHRIDRKHKTKEETRKLDDRILTNPEETKDLLIHLDKARAKERVTLKHRNTGKWAKGMIRFGKYDHTARNLIAEQLQKSRELTKKIAEVNDDDAANDEVDNGSNTKVSLSDINNPWFAGSVINKQQEGGDHSKLVALKPVIGHVTQEESDGDGEDDDGDDACNSVNDGEVGEHSEANHQIMNTSDEPFQTFDSVDNANEAINTDASYHPLEDKSAENDTLWMSDIQDEANIHPTPCKQGKETGSTTLCKMLTRKPTYVESVVPELIVQEDQKMADKNQHLMNIQEAFAEDDIVKVFQEEKQDRIDRDKPKDVDISLPGWGAWGGVGIKSSKRKNKRFLIKSKPAQPRRDENLQHVLINENRDKKIAVHQVNKLPFPFSTSDQFERSVRAPVGSTWNTPSAVKQLTIPKITTKMGAIIEPITAAEAFKQKRNRRPDPTHEEHQVITDIALNKENTRLTKGQKKQKQKRNK